MNKHQSTEYLLPLPKELHSYPRIWLILSVSSLALAGLFAVLLVLARTPILQEFVPHDFFHTALVVHVDLSVLVWLLSISCLLWSLVSQGHSVILHKTLLGLAIFGMGCFVLSAFMPGVNPILNNYVPVLQTPLFFIGLSMFAVAIMINLGLALATPIIQRGIAKNAPCPASLFAILTAALITVIAFLCFTLSISQLNKLPFVQEVGLQEYYEMLFWGGGHILQFTYTQILLLVWLVLASHIGLAPLPPKKLMVILFGFALLITLPSPASYLFYDVASLAHTEFFTQHMRHGGGVAAVPVILYLIIAFIKNGPPKAHTPAYYALLFSLLLFIAGGLLGFLIQGSNVIIPAHYHGSIVGVTLAFMGLVYYLLPRLGYAEVTGKWAITQPILYGTGQLLHITGLAWSGGYGALRKTPGAVESIEGQAAMGLMGFGGLLATLGGLLFVIVAFTSVLRK